MAGFVVGLVGGRWSILPVPLLVYVVGVRFPHVAIGTPAVAAGALDEDIAPVNQPITIRSAWESLGADRT